MEGRKHLGTKENIVTKTECSPYLTLVICSRNDNHGGNALRRMQVSFSGVLGQLERYCIESELILIDWNPPPDKPILKEVIEWPCGLNYCTIRIIEVPPSIHRRYRYHDKMPMHATLAVNCGIRRSRGQFILPGTIDLLYSDDLMCYIASKKLKSDHRYRIDRCDVDRNVVQFNTLREQLEYCEKNIIHRHHFAPGEPHDSFPRLHTNNCGDFQLMSRKYWIQLRGYREADIIVAHVDGLLSYASYVAGVKEVILSDPMRLYHIDHDDKFNDRLRVSRPYLETLISFPFIPERVRNKIISLYRKFLGDRTKSEVYGIATLSHSEYLNLCRDMVAGKRPYIFNGDQWGLGEENLPEFVISTAVWDQELRRKNF